MKGLVNWNGLVVVGPCINGTLELTVPCIKSVMAQTIPVSVLVVDNQSTDDVSTKLKRKFPTEGMRSIMMQYYPRRASVAKVWNRALAWGFAQGYDRVLVINNDVELPMDCYQVLSGYLEEHPEVGMATGVGVRTREEMDARKPGDKLNDRPHPDFSCFMIRDQCWERLLGFDEGFEGAYYEDGDFHVRAHLNGIKLMSAGMPYLHHASQASKLAGEGERWAIGEYHKRNKKRFVEKWGCDMGSDAYGEIFKAERFGEVLKQPVGST